ncbi:MAG TPA: ATP-binding protein [Chloroflexota bacterium]|nr:ATP-binding protein [Chloroflexota bacterium]
MTVYRSSGRTELLGLGDSALERVARIAGSTLDREELLQALFVELNRSIPCDSLGFYWREPGESFCLVIVRPGLTAIEVEQTQVVGEAPGADDKPQPYCCQENSSSTHPVLRWLAAHDLSSSLNVPVVVAQQLLGYFVANRTGSHAFAVADLHPLVQIAGMVGPSLNSMQLYERLELAHQNLKATRDELARSERLMVQGELASGVAHDINNILGLISARTDLLKLQGLPPQAAASAEAISQAVDDGITVVRRMTQFTRRQRKQEVVPLDVNKLVDDVMEMTRPRWQSASSLNKVSVRFTPGPISTVLGVPSELREVMVNLVMNAVDAMPSGGWIRIDVEQADGHAYISVADTGCGMSEEVREHIFDPFFTTKGESGSGLGLWVSHGIVVRHGGDIEVHSEVGKGSRFRVRLPLARAVQEQAPKRVECVEYSILVVDDEAGLGEALRLSLEMAGYHVLFSANPRQALEIFKQEQFDLVITDLRMPGMSGWELASEIKRFNPATPIIAMTGWPVDLIRDGQRCSEMEAIIQKPYRVNDLRAKVARILAERKEKP